MSIASNFVKKAGQRFEKLTAKEQTYVSKVLKCVDSVEQKAKVLEAAGFPRDSVVLSDWCKRVAAPPGIGTPGSLLGGLVTRYGGLESVDSVVHELKRISKQDLQLGTEFAEINRKFASSPEIQKTGEYVLNVKKAISNVETAKTTLEKAGLTSEAGSLEYWLKQVQGYHTERTYTDGTILGIDVPDPYTKYEVKYTPGFVEKIGVGPGKLSIAEAQKQLRQVTSPDVAQALREAKKLTSQG